MGGIFACRPMQKVAPTLRSMSAKAGHSSCGSRTSTASTASGAVGFRSGIAASIAPMRAISAGWSASRCAGIGLSWNTSAPMRWPSPSSAGCTNSCSAISWLRNTGLACVPRPLSSRTVASVTRLGAFTTKRKSSGTMAA
ncbi:hypothetical protein D9M68_386700 [compost metagenome]